MPIDRDAALKTAERLLRQGKLDEAIEQYVRLVEEQPRDWSSINTLGDLYVRAGNTERAVAQYVRIADHLFNEGFLPKATALYKKALKVRGDHEHTLFRLSDIAAQQGLLADAKLYLRQLAQQRKTRGDQRGVAECTIRMALIDEYDADAKVAAAQIAEGMGDLAQAAALLRDAARVFEKEKRDADALNARIAALQLSPDDARLRGEVATALIAAGEFDRAQSLLPIDVVGDDVDLLLAAGRNDLLAGRSTGAHATLMRVAALAPDRQSAIAALADELLAAGRVADAYGCVEILVDAAMFEAAFERAAVLLEEFVTRQVHVPALVKLVSVYADAGLREQVTATQERLADAYLEQGRAAEARVIADDLLSREPHVERHVQRQRRALLAPGIGDPSAVARMLEAEPSVHPVLDLPGTKQATAADALPQGSTSDAVRVSLAGRSHAADGFSEGTDPTEIDLNAVLAELHVTARTIDRKAIPPAQDAEARRSRGADIEEQSAEAAALMERAQQHLRRGNVAASAYALQAAAHVLAIVMEIEADAGASRDGGTPEERLTRGSAPVLRIPNGERR